MILFCFLFFFPNIKKKLLFYFLSLTTPILFLILDDNLSVFGSDVKNTDDVVKISYNFKKIKHFTVYKVCKKKKK